MSWELTYLAARNLHTQDCIVSEAERLQNSSSRCAQSMYLYDSASRARLSREPLKPPIPGFVPAPTEPWVGPEHDGRNRRSMISISETGFSSRNIWGGGGFHNLTKVLKLYVRLSREQRSEPTSYPPGAHGRITVRQPAGGRR